MGKILSGHELKMDSSEIIVTKTDLQGKITYGNRTFFKYAGYSKKETLGQQHNLVRHPEMPRTVFKLLWDTITRGEEIFAYVNNRAQNGDYYWVLAHVTPSYDSSGKLDGYHSNRRAPNRQVLSNKVIPLYEQLLQIERQAGSPKQGLAQGEDHVRSALAESKMEFNELMFAWGA